MAPTIWIDGKYCDEANAKISVFDHGLLYGDGVFEGIRVYNRRIFRLHQHLDRLYASAKAAWIEIPLARDAMDRVLGEVVAKSGIADAYIRLIVTRGIGDLGLDPRKCSNPSVICIVDHIQLWPPDRYEKGLTAISAATPVNHRESLSPRIKSLNDLCLTGTAPEVIGVTKLDARTVGAGVPGPVTKELARRFKALATRGD